MSLVAALAGFSSVPASKIPPPPDSVIEQIRPNGRSIAEILVAPQGGDFTTMKAAAAAIPAIQLAKRTAEGCPILTPNYRVDVIVKPGIYGEEVASPQFVAWYGDGPRGSIQLQQYPTAELPLVGVLTTAGNIYWEGIDVVELYQDSYVQVGGKDYPKYPIHGTAYGTSIFTRCTLDSRKAAGATPCGSDGIDGGTILFYDCDMTGNTNNHGEAGTRVPQTTMYVNCRNTGYVNWDALNAVAVDHLWVVGGNVGGVSLAGTASKLHLDPATIVGAGGVTRPSGSQDDDTDWPIPLGGLSAADRAYYGM